MSLAELGVEPVLFVVATAEIRPEQLVFAVVFVELPPVLGSFLLDTPPVADDVFRSDALVGGA